MQADNASAITPRHVEFYNAVYSAGNPVPSALYWEVATGVAGFDQFQPPAFFDRLREYDRLTHSRLSRTFIDQLTLLLLLFAAVDDVVSEPEAGFVNACSDLLLALCGGLEGDRPALKADEFVTRPRTSAPPEEEPAPAVSDEFLLRTQTSGGQIRTMDSQKPPIKVLIPGRVFRSDSDATHSPMFHQMEGLVVDKGITLGDLQGALNTFVQKLFGADTRTRLRPSYFPFTEPSVEVDVSCFECHGKGCPLCKHTGWIEVLGGGVVNRKVLENCNIDPDEYSGFAFGIGIERIAMLKYGINNIGLMFENNLQFLKQFHE